MGFQRERFPLADRRAAPAVFHPIAYSIFYLSRFFPLAIQNATNRRRIAATLDKTRALSYIMIKNVLKKIHCRARPKKDAEEPSSSHRSEFLFFDLFRNRGEKWYGRN